VLTKPEAIISHKDMTQVSLKAPLAPTAFPESLNADSCQSVPLLDHEPTQHHGATKSKSWKRSWSLSFSGRHSFGGVRIAFSDVNSSSKLLTSSGWR